MAATGDPLEALAMRALGLVRDGTVVGLGTGRAATAFPAASRWADGYEPGAMAESRIRG